MMTAGVRARLLAFVVLSAVGIVYVTGNYLGLVDRILGRGITVHATLPDSGGLFVGSEVTYRGVKVGKVTSMDIDPEGLLVTMDLEEGTRIPQDAPVRVHNLSAVGEQYIDFAPEDGEGPYAGEGFTFRGDADSLPIGEDEVLIKLDAFVNSVDKENLSSVIQELGILFRDTGEPLQQLIDGGSEFIEVAAEHTDETIKLLDQGLRVLRTQKEQGENITAFSRDLAALTDVINRKDPELRQILDASPSALREVNTLLTELEPTIPVLLANMITVNQVVVNHLDGVEQLLVSFPLAVAGGFTGTPGDGWGHVNIQLAQSPGPCRGEGYMPASEWRRGDQLNDTAVYPAQCLNPGDSVQRGSLYAPGRTGGANSTGKAYRGTYDPLTGLVDAQDKDGNQVSVHSPKNLSVLGNDSWKWLLVGPVAE
ncbi:MlaD family protein [Nocardioides sp. AE5]|uniref:MlaD family protein n=1 Tax=Nocardioides sp. AE5 TaxID=2962573 RepID=UPI00288282B1|nr:MlaD family protein [Nocardioides sp. AE5]MDT0201427.1 MlaD family protein [Nocardioides sp. AE5]